jgi:hypothetical protein
LIQQVLKVKSETLVPANPDILDGVDDLMQLSYLNEPAVLYNLEYRYNQDMIYTKAGPVLVAVNPFKEVPLYGNRNIEAYRKRSNESPHVYAIADTAIREMIRGWIMIFFFNMFIFLMYYILCFQSYLFLFPLQMKLTNQSLSVERVEQERLRQQR